MAVRSLLLFVAIVVGLILVAIGIVYLTVQVHSIPSILPGHVAGVTGHRTKRGVAALVLGGLCLLAAALFAALSRPRTEP